MEIAVVGADEQQGFAFTLEVGFLPLFVLFRKLVLSEVLIAANDAGSFMNGEAADALAALDVNGVIPRSGEPDFRQLFFFREDLSGARGPRGCRKRRRNGDGEDAHWY